MNERWRSVNDFLPIGSAKYYYSYGKHGLNNNYLMWEEQNVSAELDIRHSDIFVTLVLDL